MADNNRSQEQQQDQNPETPGLIGSHYQYVKGAAEATVGVLTGSSSWKASGERDKAEGLAALKKVGEHRDPNQGYGRVEEYAGKLTGCQGMQREGAASSPKKD
ncbi:hypothetical protein BGZ63DRAFT_392019 [Mariannaea sp. PMI_226]|nr:hypothetical protein BGZ63DRAFT_392019 [Mariannaea sp. PMI_226]